MREGSVKYKEDITDGLEKESQELVRLLRSENFGKKINRISEDAARIHRSIKLDAQAEHAGCAAVRSSELTRPACRF